MPRLARATRTVRPSIFGRRGTCERDYYAVLSANSALASIMRRAQSRRTGVRLTQSEAPRRSAAKKASRRPARPVRKVARKASRKSGRKVARRRMTGGGCSSCGACPLAAARGYTL